MELKPIPAFYCCYLLRSTTSNVYVGSTPHPVRRLAQHNGITKGGAYKTFRSRPWEMTCVVAGFPSNIAALQFEWAWQKPHRSRHLADIEVKPGRSKNARYSEYTEEFPKPSRSLIDKLTALHKLLRASYFSKWPLEAHFFARDVLEEWESRSERFEVEIDPFIRCFYHSEASESRSMSKATRTLGLSKVTTLNDEGVTSIDPTYRPFRSVFEKAQFLLHEHEEIDCSVCSCRLDMGKDLVVLCSHADCNAVSHINCLSSMFLAECNAHNSLVPTTGRCLSCKSALRWSSLMKELTIRLRAPQIVNKALLKPNHARSKKNLEEFNEFDDEPDPFESDVTAASFAKEGTSLSDDDDVVSSMSLEPSRVRLSSAKQVRVAGRSKAPIEIEDSEEDQ